MEPTLVTLAEKQLVGKSVRMSIRDIRTGELWRSFLPRRKEIHNPIGTELYSMQVFVADYFKAFSSANEFDKWAAVEVTDFTAVPDGLETFTLPKGFMPFFITKASVPTPACTSTYTLPGCQPLSTS